MPQMSAGELRSHILGLLPHEGEGAPRNLLANELLAALIETPSATQNRVDQDLLDPSKYYAVRESDLDLLPKITELLIAAATKADLAVVAKLAGVLSQH